MKRVVVNKNREDIHVDDKINRVRLIRYLRDTQDELGISDRDLSARVGHGPNWSASLYRQNSWRMATLQELVRAFGLTLHLEVNSKVPPIPAEGPTFSELYAANPNPARREEAARIDLMVLFGRLRKALDLSAAEVGRRMGVEGGKVTEWETGETPYFLVVTAQRYFRALGAELTFVLEDENGKRFAAPPTMTDTIVAASWEAERCAETVKVVRSDTLVKVWNSRNPRHVATFPVEVWDAWVAGRNI